MAFPEEQRSIVDPGSLTRLLDLWDSSEEERSVGRPRTAVKWLVLEPNEFASTAFNSIFHATDVAEQSFFSAESHRLFLLAERELHRTTQM